MKKSPTWARILLHVGRRTSKPNYVAFYLLHLSIFLDHGSGGTTDQQPEKGETLLDDHTHGLRNMILAFTSFLMLFYFHFKKNH